jgi:hypothetical protein
MVAIRHGFIKDYNWSIKAVGRIKRGRRSIEIRFSEPLYAAILAEAKLREWSFSHMVRHLCEASINGIE